MTPQRFEQCLDLIGWSVLGVAKKLGVSELRSRRWAEGRYPVPKDVAHWLERLATVHAKYPPPHST